MSRQKGGVLRSQGSDGTRRDEIEIKYEDMQMQDVVIQCKKGTAYKTVCHIHRREAPLSNLIPYSLSRSDLSRNGNPTVEAVLMYSSVVGKTCTSMSLRGRLSMVRLLFVCTEVDERMGPIEEARIWGLCGVSSPNIFS